MSKFLKILRRLKKKFIDLIIRPFLRAGQNISARIANMPFRKAPTIYEPVPGSRWFHKWDLLLANKIAQSLGEGDKVLDIGCGNGHRLAELSLFKPLGACHGVDLAPPTPPPSLEIVVDAFDGKTLPFPDNEFDVSLVCHVLHHLTRPHARRLLEETLRVTKRCIYILEDSLPEWSFWYRVRNWCHRTESDLAYSSGADTYISPQGQNMFLTHSDWLAFMQSFPSIEEVAIESLDDIMRYRHHTMIRSTIKKPK